MDYNYDPRESYGLLGWLVYSDEDMELIEFEDDMDSIAPETQSQ